MSCKVNICFSGVTLGDGRRHMKISHNIFLKYLSTSSCLDEGCHCCGSPLFAPSESMIEDFETCCYHSDYFSFLAPTSPRILKNFLKFKKKGFCYVYFQTVVDAY